MARYPREEIPYKKIYKSLDVDRELNIKWPIIEEPEKVVFVDESIETFIHSEVEALDEFDAQFCSLEKIEEKEFRRIYELLDQKFKNQIFNRLKSLKPVSSSSFCDICGYTECKENEIMLTCQGCSINVHDSCYGETDPVSGRWLCRKCIFYFEEGFCKFCDKKEGILKRTDTNEWCHPVCALLNPGLSFVNENSRDPIETTEFLALKGTCKLCNMESSSLIKCTYEGCDIVYHASCCAESNYSDLNNKITYCQDHDPLRPTSRVKSKRKLLKTAENYPELNFKVFLRNRCKLSIPKATEYLEIVNTKATTIASDKADNKKIEKYWIWKTNEFHYYFDDIFMLSNYFRNLQK